MTIPTMWPVDFPCNQRFGENPASYQPDGHTGMDFACPVGTPVRAVAAGTVLYEGWAQGLGWPNPYYINPDFTPNDGIDQSAGIVVVIDHGPFASVYGHLSQTGLSAGDPVALGEIFAQTGNTGFSSGAHLHFEILPDGWNVLGKWYGRINPETVIGLAPDLAADQRVVAAGRTAKGRTEPNGGAPVVREVPGGAVEVFDGWAYGEDVNGVNVWYHDTTPAWYWAGNFEDHSTNGLPDLNPKAEAPPAANQRDTAAVVRRRSLPDKNSTLLEEFAADLRLDFRGYVTGTDPYGDGNRVWFVGAYGAASYFHSSGFTNQGTDGLADLTAELFPPAAVTPAPAPTAPAPAPAPAVEVPYDFVLDFGTLNGIRVEKIPANLTNVDVGNFPAAPSTAVCHWWNRLEVHPAISSVIGEFTRAGSYKSAHWAVSVDRIIQFVSLKDRAYHAGAGGNGWVGIEVDPVATERGADGRYTDRALKVQANVRALLEALRERKGYKFQTTLHKLVPGNNTACSDLDLTTFEVQAVPPVDPPKPTDPPVPTAPVIPAGLTPEQTAELQALAEFLLSRKEKING